MNNGIRYTVSTRWGHFSLDEGSYQDYLQGKLWISWGTEKTANAEAASTALCAPANVSQEALALRDRAARDGFLETLGSAATCGSVPIPYKSYLKDVSIYELSLSVRATNGLMRAKVDTFGKLVDLMASERGIAGVRNLGAKSIKEIKRAFCTESYHRMTPYDKAVFWERVLNR